jgi:6-phosphogluconolactonase (cycloisomerase 2 family)
LRVTPNGKLIPIAKASVPVAGAASPSQALVSPSGDLLFGADFLGGLVRSFQIGGNGRLLPVQAQAPPLAPFAGTTAPLPLGMAVHPVRRLFYVCLVNINGLATYAYDRPGAFLSLNSVPNTGHAPCWVVVNAAGTKLYTGNTGDNSVSVYDLSNDPTTPVQIQQVTLKLMGNPFQIGLDPEGKFLHVVTQRGSASLPASANALHVLKVDSQGLLKEVDSSPTTLSVPNDGTRPQGVVAL